MDLTEEEITKALSTIKNKNKKNLSTSYRWNNSQFLKVFLEQSKRPSYQLAEGGSRSKSNVTTEMQRKAVITLIHIGNDLQRDDLKKTGAPHH